jgi:rhodanese-related sulfurtransferase
MIEVYNNLFVGDERDYESNIRLKNQDKWNILHACKEPYHRQALGYSGRGAPKSHPEYLVAKRDHRLILNLIDADDPKYIPKEIIDEALEFIEKSLSNNKKVLVHCNQGMSRSPGIAMLYLAQKGEINSESFPQAQNEFKEIYPQYNLSNGIRGFLSRYWDIYMNQN